MRAVEELTFSVPPPPPLKICSLIIFSLMENRCSGPGGGCLSALHLSSDVLFNLTLYFASVHSPPQSLCLSSVLLSFGVLRPAAVFLYINSCTLKTIQLLINLHLWAGLFFPSHPPVANTSLPNACLLLFFSVFWLLLRAGPAPTGMAHFFFLLLWCRLPCARAFRCKHIILPHACLASLKLLLYC